MVSLRKNMLMGKESWRSIRRGKVENERTVKQKKPTMSGCTGCIVCALSNSSRPSQPQLRNTVSSGLETTKTTRRNPVAVGTHRRDKAQYLINTRVKEFKGSMAGRAKRAFLDEL